MHSNRLAVYALPALIALAGCGQEGGDVDPRDDQDGHPSVWDWTVQDPEALGLDVKALEAARAYAFAPGKNTQGVVVVWRGDIVAEWYADGAGPDSYATSWSVAKSFTSALVGIAIDEGALPGVDMPLTGAFPSWQGTPHADIRLEHVLHMASGLEWVESYDADNAAASDVAQLVTTVDSPLAYVVAQPLEFAPGTNHEYSSGDTLLLSGLLEHATGSTVADYAADRLFAPLGIEGADWWRATTGETLTYCCLDMTTRDFARFGLLYLQGGRWGDEQVVPASWVEASLAPSSLVPWYGYQWWRLGIVDDALPDDLFAALGHDGQYLYVIPSLDLVVVRNGLYRKQPGEPVAEPNLFTKLPPQGLVPEAGTVAPDSWSDAEFLAPILTAIGG